VFILRSVSEEDINDLYELSGKVLFLNLPNNLEVITEKVKRSIECFKNPSNNLENDFYYFVLEDTKIKKVIGVSMIHAQHGTEKEPHFFFTVSSEHKYSQTINTGFVHGTLKLGLDTDGPTEIGGLVIHPDYRGNKDKLGKQISFIRFLYMALNPSHFKPTIHSELMPPFDSEGNSPLWEAIGRRFLNMNYDEADLLSRNNKEFILSLFPSDNIYMTLLPFEARNAVGKVGKDTEPVKNMLEKIGFKYMNEVDPFDGGPHYRALLNDITLIKNFKNLNLIINEKSLDHEKDYLVSFNNPKYPFFAVKTKASIDGNNIILNSEVVNKYHLKEGDNISIIPF